LLPFCAVSVAVGVGIAPWTPAVFATVRCSCPCTLPSPTGGLFDRRLRQEHFRARHISSKPLLPAASPLLCPSADGACVPSSRIPSFPPFLPVSPLRGTSFEGSKPAEQYTDRKAGNFGSVGENRGGGAGGGAGAVGQAAGSARGVAWATGAENDEVRRRGRRAGRPLTLHGGALGRKFCVKLQGGGGGGGGGGVGPLERSQANLSPATSFG